MYENGTVFIVDDDEAVRDSLSWLVRSVGLPTETFDSGQAFLDRYDGDQPGCLVLDIRMPGISGLELLGMLTERDLSIPVIVVTGHGDVPMAVRALKAGAVDFIEKPFNDQLLLDTIQNALQRDAKARAEQREHTDLRERFGLLTPREREVLKLVVEGNPNKRISSTLGISQKTVEVHRANIMEKLEARSVADLVRMTLAVQASHASSS